MNDETFVINSNFGVANRLQDVEFIRKLYSTIGRVATRGLFLLPASTQQPVDNTVTSQFISSLQNLHHPPVNDMNEIDSMIDRSNEVLAKATTVFPLTLFPDTIILDRTKLTVIRRTFFFSEDVMSIRIEDILNVSAAVGPFFGSITIATRVLSSDDHFTINKFLRQDAMHLKHMIQGYVIARHNNIACDHLTHDDLINTLRELGHEKHKPTPSSGYASTR